jgi:hypothetical protein
MMMGGGPKELSRTPIKLGDIPGMELVVRVEELSGKVIMRGYYDQPNGRLFVAMIAGKGLEPNHENVKRFFDSFEILKEGEKKEAEKKDGEKVGHAVRASPELGLSPWHAREGEAPAEPHRAGTIARSRLSRSFVLQETRLCHFSCGGPVGHAERASPDLGLSPSNTRRL